MKRAVTIIAALFVLIIVGRHLRPTSSSDGFNINEFSELPVQVGGRIKPLDTVARNTLLVLASRQKVVSPSGETLSPIEWLLDLTMRPEKADTYRVFKIEFPDDLGLLLGLISHSLGRLLGSTLLSRDGLEPHLGPLGLKLS